MKAIILALALLTLTGCSAYTTSTRPVLVGFSLGVGLEEHIHRPVPSHRHHHHDRHHHHRHHYHR